MCAVASASAAFRVQVWQLSRGDRAQGAADAAGEC